LRSGSIDAHKHAGEVEAVRALEHVGHVADFDDDEASPREDTGNGQTRMDILIEDQNPASHVLFPQAALQARSPRFRADAEASRRPNSCSASLPGTSHRTLREIWPSP